MRSSFINKDLEGGDGGKDVVIASNELPQTIGGVRILPRNIL